MQRITPGGCRAGQPDVANVDVTISVIDDHVGIIATALETPDPGLPAPRLTLVDRVTGMSVPVQAIILP
jgi:hypothetical protein